MAERGRRGGRGRGGRGRGAQEVPLFDDADDRHDVPAGDCAAMQARIDYLQQRLARWEPVEGVDANSESDDASEEEAVVHPFARNGFRNHVADPTRDFGIRVDIPEWDGKAEPDAFIDWIHNVEHFFDLKNVPESTKVKLVALKLRKHASIWWEHLKKQRARAGKNKVQSWVKMKKLLRQKFLPTHFRQDAFIDYHGCRQGLMSVEGYSAEFDRLRMRCDVDEEEEEQTIARYLGGLKSEVSDVVQLQQYVNYDDVCRLALKVEKQLTRKRAISRWEIGFRVDIPDFDGGLRAEEWHYETVYGEPIYDEYPVNDVLCGLTVNSPVQASEGIGNGTEEVRYGPAYDNPIFDEYPEEEILDGKIPFIHQSGSKSGAEEYAHGDEDEEVEADHAGIAGKVESEGEVEGLGDANTGNGVGAVPPRPEQFLSNGVVAAVDKLSWLCKGTRVMVDQRSLVISSIGRRNTQAFVMKGKQIVLTPREAQTRAISIQQQRLTRYVWDPGAAGVDSRTSPFQPGENDAAPEGDDDATTGDGGGSRGPLRGPRGSFNVRV